MPAEAPCVACGYVESVRYITKEGEGTGAGAVMGGVAGGVIGHQVGSGRGNDAATVLGALGGAYAGHQIEKNARKKTFWQVRVRLDTGEVRYLTYGNQPAFRQGDRVSLASGRLALIANQ
jgi:outer membrane lipoprotein SlyB